MKLARTLGAGVLGWVLVASSSGASQHQPLESPDGDDEDCFEWKYPKNDACGKLSGTTECKPKPTIEASDDAAKKEACKPTKGDDCLCE